MASELQKISVTLGKTLLPFLLFGLLVDSLQVIPERENHDDGQPIGRNTYPVRISVSRTPRFRPYVRSGDVPQLTERVDERDNNSSL